MIKTFKQLKHFVKCDLFRYMGKIGYIAFLRSWFTPGFRFSFYLRVSQYTIGLGLIHWIFRLRLRHYQFKYGISIHHTTEIGPGLYIGHFGGIVVNPNSRIGANVNLSPNILIGHKYNKQTGFFEYPTIGNRVAIGNGSKIIGGVNVGDDSVIGLNTIITHDVPNKAVVVGMPQKIISMEGSSTIVGSFIE